MTSPAHTGNPSDASVTGGAIAGPGTLTGPIDLAAARPSNDVAFDQIDKPFEAIKIGGYTDQGYGGEAAAEVPDESMASAAQSSDGLSAPAEPHITPPADATVTSGAVTGTGTLTGPIGLDAAAPAGPHVQAPSDSARGITINSTEAQPGPSQAAGAAHAETPPAGHGAASSESFEITDGAKGPTCDNV